MTETPASDTVGSVADAAATAADSATDTAARAAESVKDAATATADSVTKDAAAATSDAEKAADAVAKDAAKAADAAKANAAKATDAVKKDAAKATDAVKKDVAKAADAVKPVEPPPAPPRSMDDIEADLAKTRERLAVRLDEFTEYVNPKNVADRQVAKLKGVFVDEYGGIKPDKVLIAAGVAVGIIAVFALARRRRG